MITSIPILRTSWYERRALYWLRRVTVSFLLGFACACVAALDYAMVAAAGPGMARWIVLSVLIAYVIATGSYEFTKAYRQRLAKPVRLSRNASRRAGRVGAVTGILARSGFLVGQVFIVVTSILAGGVLLAFFVGSFLPELDNERWARNAIADQLDEEARIIERNRQRQARRHPAPQETSEP